jgi:succinate dehydrogenase / fumarate reductase iron-sulfur subunit
MNRKIDLKLKIWRQKNSKESGAFEIYEANGLDIDMSMLEVFDAVNERLTKEGKDPIVFDHDCREGICGMCGAVVNGKPNGPVRATTLCELHVRHFQDGETVVIEPWRAKAFPVIKDLVVDRSSFDRIISAGGFTSIKIGAAPDANALPIPQENVGSAMDAASCIGCGACVAACPNAAAMLFVGAKVSHLSLLPQGHIEARQRVRKMVERMDTEGFGNCTNEYECEAACPKMISVANIARMNREFYYAQISS